MAANSEPDAPGAELPIWRSLLYVPAHIPRFIDKAHTRGADAIILDLEDSVPAAERDGARAMVAESADKVSQGGADVIVRINRPDAEAEKDLSAAVIPGVTALMLPKVDDGAHVRAIAGQVAALEKQRGRETGATAFVVMVESPAALLKAAEIAAAHPRNVAAVLGGEDFATAAGMVPDPETLFLPKLLTLFAARAAGIAPLGMIGTVADYRDLEAVREVVRRSRRFGFEGASCIHPSVVALLNEEMSPGTEEVGRAERIVDAYGKAEREGIGAIAVDGMMIDVPVAERAKALLRRHAAIRARDAKGGDS
ncbi:MAG: CoA ester lyase [Proteobacteria bacterium]|nr:CoA ester lyase [Pseudomonadota bacterium]